MASFARDAAGRVTRQVLPSGRTVGSTFDAAGNLTGITPPERPEHAFTYTARDEVAAYTPPRAGPEDRTTRFVYDADRQPLRMERAGGQTNTFQFDDSGRLRLLDLVARSQTYDYDAAGRLASVVTTQGVALTYAYDGSLVTGVTWSGAVAGSVGWSHDDQFRVSEQRVDGADPIAFQYDDDGLPIQAGGLSVTRSAQNGLVAATTLGAIGDAITYDAFGAPVAYEPATAAARSIRPRTPGTCSGA